MDKSVYTHYKVLSILFYFKHLPIFQITDFLSSPAHHSFYIIAGVILIDKASNCR